MATDFTPNYNLDKYTGTDKPNLRDQYNAAMDKIDTALLSANTNASDAKSIAQGVAGDIQDKADANLLPSSEFSTSSTVKDAIDSKANQSDFSALYAQVQDLEFSVSDVRRYGAKEKDATIDWANIVSQITQVSDCVFFPSGEWYINSQINISGIHTIVGCGAKLTARQSMQAIIKFTPATNQTGPQVSPVSSVNGIFFDGNSLALDALQIVGANACVSNCRFLDYTSHGINMTSLGLDCVNCQFGEDSAKFASNCVGIHATTDCHITGCKFFGQKTCIEIGEQSEVVNCLFYPGDDNVYQSTAIASYRTDYFARSISVVGCEFDTMGICFCDIGGNVIGNNFYWNTKPSLYKNEIILFAFKSPNAIEDNKTMAFSNNSFVMPYLSGRTFHTFGALEANVSSYISYTSENISLRIQDEAMPYTYVFFGLNRAAKNAMYSTPQNYVGLFTVPSGFADAHLCGHFELSNRGAQLGMGCYVTIWDTNQPHHFQPSRAIVISMVANETEKMYIKPSTGSGPLMLMPYTPASISKAQLATLGALEYRFFPASQRDSLISTYGLARDSGNVYTYSAV